MRRALFALYALVLGTLCVLLFLWPAFELSRALLDPRMGGPEPAAQTWRWHRALTPAYADWARQRVASGEAALLSMHDISGTEWPLFGTVFFLRATENLDLSWQRAPRGERPAVYARAAIDASADLLADPAHATWVQRHWGARHYLRRENVFYRMLLIDGLATQLRMTGETPHRALLLQQVQSLAGELSNSSNGLLADYPAQIFPADVAAAWHAIRRADSVLGTDHQTEAAQGVRGFVDAMAPQLGLPPYAWFGEPAEPTEVRGCANAWLLHHAPFLWPEIAREWARLNHRHFWSERFGLAGWREFQHGHEMGFYADVDSGPVLLGFGTSATAFGIGAQRSLGQAREARMLGLQAIAASVPLPNGRLLVPRLLSDLGDAPLLGEAALLYNLSQPPAPSFPPAGDPLRWGDIPTEVWGVLVLQFVLGTAGLARAWRHALRSLRRQPV